MVVIARDTDRGELVDKEECKVDFVDGIVEVRFQPALVDMTPGYNEATGEIVIRFKYN